MSVGAKVIRKMVALGLSPAEIADLCELIEEGFVLPAAMSPGALRTRRWRAKNEAKASQSVTKASPCDASPERHQTSQSVTERHAVTPLARVEDKTLKPRTIDKTDADDSACANDDWPKGDARQQAAELVQAAATSRLDPARSPGLATTLGRLPMWKASGASWLFDVVPTVTAVAKKARSSIGTWGYFDNAIAQSIADNRKALEIPEARMSMGQGPPSYVDQQLAIKSEARRIALAKEKPDGLPN